MNTNSLYFLEVYNTKQGSMNFILKFTKDNHLSQTENDNVIYKDFNSYECYEAHKNYCFNRFIYYHQPNAPTINHFLTQKKNDGTIIMYNVEKITEYKVALL
jgi:hypothetical protein